MATISSINNVTLSPHHRQNGSRHYSKQKTALLSSISYSASLPFLLDNFLGKQGSNTEGIAGNRKNQYQNENEMQNQAGYFKIRCKS